MKRLTEKRDGVNVIPLRNSVRGADLPYWTLVSPTVTERFLAGDAADRLAAYEETWLEPEICAEYKKFEDEAISRGVTFSRIVELMKAEEEGRLLVLPEEVSSND